MNDETTLSSELKELTALKKQTAIEVQVEHKNFANELKYGLGDKIMNELNTPHKKPSRFKGMLLKIKNLIKGINNTL